MADEPSGEEPDEDGEADRSGTDVETEGGFEFGAVDGEPSDGDKWDRVPITPTEGQGARTAEDTPASEADSSTDADPYGPEPRSTPVLPGDPSLESAVFVALGAVAMVLVIVRLVSIAFV